MTEWGTCPPEVRRQVEGIVSQVKKCLNAQHAFAQVDHASETDPDLAAHLTVTKHRGICVYGAPISEIFLNVPVSDYWQAIRADFQDCLQNIAENPVYCILNLVRVYWFSVEGEVRSKKEAGLWGIKFLPEPVRDTVRQALLSYVGEIGSMAFSNEELVDFRDYFAERVR